MVTASGLLESSHCYPSLDYETLLRWTLALTGSYDQVLKLFRLACFNVLAHNQDDHAKNFAFLYDEPTSSWYLSPAYDLTYSVGIGGEHATSVHGKGREIETGDLIALARGAGLDDTRVREIVGEVATGAEPLLRCYSKIA